MQKILFAEPAVCCRLGVFVFAAVVFPLHLGWAGAPLLTLGGYLVVASALFAIADALTDCSLRRLRALSLVELQAPTLLMIAVPALLAFAVGHAAAPAEEAFEDQLCLSAGFSGTSDTAAAESDDLLDLTADCL